MPPIASHQGYWVKVRYRDYDTFLSKQMVAIRRISPQLANGKQI